jgi:hypothetical protein
MKIRHRILRADLDFDHDLSSESPKSCAEELEDLAVRVNRNGPTRLRPEYFHVEKSDIAAALRRIARDQRKETRREANTTWRPPAKAAAGQ